MPQLWTRVIIKNRIAAQVTLPMDGGLPEVMEESCRKLDIPKPIWLGKHEREYNRFERTSFLPEHFIEKVAFDRLEIERIDPDNHRGKPNDPRSEA